MKQYNEFESDEPWYKWYLIGFLTLVAVHFIAKYW
jgi:hypothetical protein